MHWFPVPVPSEAATVLEQSQTIAVSSPTEEMMQVVQLLQVTPSILMRAIGDVRIRCKNAIAVADTACIG